MTAAHVYLYSQSLTHIYRDGMLVIKKRVLSVWLVLVGEEVGGPCVCARPQP